MANVSITRRCARNCAYCFAEEERKASTEKPRDMSPEVFDRALDMLARSHVSEIRLLGGEPTLHPMFASYVDRALARGFRVVVFSGGLMPDSAMDRLEEAARRGVRVILNAAIPDCDDPSLVKRQQELCGRLGAQLALGINIHEPGLNVSFLLDWCDRYGLERVIRFGLAHPIYGGSNRFLHPRQYARAGLDVARFAVAASEREIAIDLDCGWSPCMFPDAFLDFLGTRPDMGLRCNPLVDILPDARLISCYALSKAACFALGKNDVLSDLQERFSRVLGPYRTMGIFKECGGCRFRREGLCVGGCLASAMRRIRSSHSDRSDLRGDVSYPEGGDLP